MSRQPQITSVHIDLELSDSFNDHIDYVYKELAQRIGSSTLRSVNIN